MRRGDSADGLPAGGPPRREVHTASLGPTNDAVSVVVEISNMLNTEEQTSRWREGGVVAARGGMPGPAKAERSVDDGEEVYNAPLTIRLKEPAGSAMRRDVRLRVDYFSGTVEVRARRVVSCLRAAAEGRALSETDIRLLESQLRAWLAANASALRTGSSTPHDLSDDSSDLVFAFELSAVRAPEAGVPPPRPLPEAEPPETSTPGPSAASRGRRRSKG